MIRWLLFPFLSHLTLCLALVGLMPTGRAGAQTAVPEVAARVTDRAATGTTTAAGTPRQQAWLQTTLDERVRLSEALAYVWGGRDLRAVAPRSDSANFPGFFSILCSVFRDSVVTIFRVIS